MTPFAVRINALKFQRTIFLGYTMRARRFAQFSALVEIADYGSFTKAAAHLGISTGSLSQTIRALEESLGVRLLNRTTRSVALTEAGERMLTRLRPLFDEFAAVVDSANAFRDRPAGHLRLTVPPPAASHLIAPLLARFLTQYPDIALEISVDPTLTDIVAGRYDAGIRAGKRIARDMIAVRLVPLLEKWMPPPTDPLFLYYPSRRQNPASLQALIDFLRSNLKTNARSRKEETNKTTTDAP